MPVVHKTPRLTEPSDPQATIRTIVAAAQRTVIAVRTAQALWKEYLEKRIRTGAMAHHLWPAPEWIPEQVQRWDQNAKIIFRNHYLAKNEAGQRIENIPERLWNIACYQAQGEVLGPAVKRILESVPEIRWSGIVEEWKVTCHDQPWREAQPPIQQILRAMEATNLAMIVGSDLEPLIEVAHQSAQRCVRLMAEQKWAFNTPTMANAGIERPMGMAACYVFEVPDDLEGILRIAQEAGMVQQSGGGVGYYLGHTRPKGDVIRSTMGRSSGPQGWIAIYNTICEQIMQGGRRRGAQLVSQSVYHPDILDFIDGDYSTANHSVVVDDEFIRHSTEDPEAEVVCVNPRTGEPFVRDGQPVRHKVGELLHHIAQRAWDSGNPGLQFFDRVNRGHHLPTIGPVFGSNPCGEQFLENHNACNLGSINLTRYVKNETLDEAALASDAAFACRMLDNVILGATYPTYEIEHAVRASELVGVGITDLAGMLIRCRLPYDSDEGRELGASAMRIVYESARAESERMAGERGCFPLWAESTWGPDGENRTMRNTRVSTIAPTGTTSFVMGAPRTGCEPPYAIAFHRPDTTHGGMFRVIDPDLLRVATEEGWASEALWDRVAERGSVQGDPDVPEHWQQIFKGAMEISPADHVRMQSELQKHVDNSISKTINLPESATVDDVMEAYVLAWKLGCKGITVFREGSRGGATIYSTGTSEKKDKAAQNGEPKTKETNTSTAAFGSLRPVNYRPKFVVTTSRYERETPLGTAFIFVSRWPVDGTERIQEVFVITGKPGTHVQADSHAIGYQASVMLQCGIDPAVVAKTLQGIGGTDSIGFGAERVRSVPDAVGQVLLEEIERLRERTGEGQVAAQAAAAEQARTTLRDLCPSCGQATWVNEAGCWHCLDPNCAASRC